MACSDDMAVFEQRAQQAEQMVAVLQASLAKLRGLAEAKEIERLSSENSRLREQVEASKRALVAAQRANGKFIVAAPKQEAAAAKPASGAAKIVAPPAAATVVPAASKPAPAGGGAKAGAAADGNNEGKKDAAKQPKQPAADAAAGKKKGPPAPAAVDVSRVSFRVGRIVTAKLHPEADKLYIEDVDCGEEKNRVVLSGLVEHIPIEQMQNRMVVLCCNLKPRKLAGIESQAMVMCASQPGQVEILAPPEGSVPGDVIEFEGYPGEPDAVLNPKKKIFEAVCPDLFTNDDCVATYKGVPFTVKGKGVCRAQTMKGAPVK